MRRRMRFLSGLERRPSSLAAEPLILIEKIEVMADLVPVLDGIIGIAQAGCSDGKIVKILEETVNRLMDEFEGSAVKFGGGLPNSALHRAGKIAMGIGEDLEILEETVDCLANGLVAAAPQLSSSLVQTLQSVAVLRRCNLGHGSRSPCGFIRA